MYASSTQLDAAAAAAAIFFEKVLQYMVKRFAAPTDKLEIF